MEHEHAAGNVEEIVKRSTDLDMSIEELWRLIATAQGWSSWLVDDAAVVIAPGETGATTHDGVEREVRVDKVTEHREVDFSWWRRDDPSYASHVHLEIVELPTGGSRLNISERLGAKVAATMSASDCSTEILSTDITWQVRFVSLWLLALHFTVMA